MILLILTAFSAPYLFAQESETGKIKELYLSGNLLTFNNFGLQYKTELKKGTFFRIGLINLFFDSSKQKSDPSSYALPSIYTDIEGSFEIGLERRKQVTEKLTAFYGINFITSTSFSRNKVEDPGLPEELRHLDSFSINPGLGFNSGFIFKIAKDFSISAEIIPRLIFKYSSNEGPGIATKVHHIITGGEFNLDNQSVRVSIIYHWIKG